MQRSVPEAVNLAGETAATQKLYGIDNKTTAVYGRRLLAARRLAERGVRYSLVYLSDYGEWDSHNKLQELHARSCARVDRPIAGLLKDLKQRGLWDDTLVVCCTEFGRTPGLEVRDTKQKFTGRDHHPHGFTVWLAGAGVKQGVIHGRTDELGFHAIEHPHYVTDLHATVLHLLGLDETRTEIHKAYTPAMLSNLLGVSVHLIRRWDRAGLITPLRRVHRLPYFSFQDVASARRLSELLAQGVPRSEIEKSLGQLAPLFRNGQRSIDQLEIRRFTRVRLSRHYPDIVSFFSTDDGITVIGIEVNDSIVRFDWPYELHTPNSISRTVLHEAARMIFFFWPIESSFSEGECC